MVEIADQQHDLELKQLLIFARHQPCGPSLRRLIKLVFARIHSKCTSFCYFVCSPSKSSTFKLVFLYGVNVCVAFVIVIYVTIFIP